MNEKPTAEAQAPARRPRCRKRILLAGLLALAAGFLLSRVLGEEDKPHFTTEVVICAQESGKQVVVLRVKTDLKQEVLLFNKGEVCTTRKFWQAESTSNSTIPIKFSKEMEFAVIAPTNDVWRYRSSAGSLDRMVVFQKLKDSVSELTKFSLQGLKDVWTSGPEYKIEPVESELITNRPAATH